MRILLDGWSLVHEPASPAALHLAALLATLPDGVELILALPGRDPGLEGLPAGLEIQSHITPRTPWGLLTWQQAALPRLSAHTGSDIIYTASTGASLIKQTNTVASPSSWQFHAPGQSSSPGSSRSFTKHLQEAMGIGGLSHAQAMFWPQDLAAPDQSLPFIRVQPLIHPLFQTNQPSPAIEFWPGVELPQTYVLYHGPLDKASIQHLLEAWSWAAGSIGTYYPLLIYGALENESPRILSAANQMGLDKSLIVLPCGSPAQLAALYFGCSALFQPGPVSPWGDPIHHAMACAKPVVAAASSWSEARLGSAGFLAAATDLRALGAELISVIVEDNLAERLSAGAKERVQSWNAADFWQALLNQNLNQRTRDSKPT